MKHFQFSLLLFFCIATHVAGQRHKTIELTFLPTDFIVSERDGLLSIDSYRHAIHFDSDVSEPALPLVLIHVLIDSDEEYVNVDATYHDVPYSKGVQVRCNPTYVPRNMISQRLSHITPPEYSKNIYPSEFVRYTGTHHVDGYTYISFFVSPFFFLTQDKELLLHEKVVLDIKLKQEPTTKAKVGRAMRNAIKSIVINKDEMATLYPEPKRERTRTGLTANSDFDYLIITRDSLRDAFQKLADWKTRKGVPTRVVTIEQIDTIPAYWQEDFYGQIHTQLGIKRAIKDYYDNYNIKYVLLGGDNDIIPSEQCHLQYKNFTSSITQVTSDLYFACLNDPIDWDFYHHNNISAEDGDRIDCHPSLPVSRLSVCSFADAIIQVNRIIEYERDPQMDIWKDSVLLAGCAYDSNWIYFDRSDVEYKGRQFLSPAINSYEADGCFHFYDTGTDHPCNASYDVTHSHFKEQFEKGYSFVQFDGHGGKTSYVLENGDSLCVQDVSTFVNPRHTIIFTSACKTNYFEEDCLSEAFMRNPYSGVIAYWGGSDRVVVEEDLWYNQSTPSVFDHMNLEIYEDLFTDADNHLGDAINVTRLNHYTFANATDPYNYIERDILINTNLLGDPEMPIYTKDPMEFDGLDIAFMNNGQLHFGFASQNQDFSYFDICVMSIDDNGESLYEIFEDIDGNGVTLNLPVGHDYSICATQPRFKPYILNVYRSGYVQNDTIANESIVWSDQAMIGRDVTTTKPQGPVVVEKDQMTIKAPQGVTIKNNFTLKKGATLVIDPTIQYIWHDPEEQ